MMKAVCLSSAETLSVSSSSFFILGLFGVEFDVLYQCSDNKLRLSVVLDTITIQLLRMDLPVI